MEMMTKCFDTGFLTTMICIRFLDPDRYFETPKIVELRKENQELESHFVILEKEVNIAYKMLENLEDRDDNIYRIIFEAEPIPSSIRQAGIGGITFILQ